MHYLSPLIIAYIAATRSNNVAAANPEPSLRGASADTTSIPSHPDEGLVSRDLSSLDEAHCKVVYRRPLFGVAGDSPLTLKRDDQGWTPLTKQYGQFGYASPDPQPNMYRKWQLHAAYWDENSGGNTNVQIKIGDDAVFTLPRVAGGWGWKTANFSHFYKKGSGSAEEISKSHALVSARLDSSAPYNNHGVIYAVDLLAYDCEIKMCDVSLRHKTGGRQSDGKWSLNNIYAFGEGGGVVPITATSNGQPGWYDTPRALP